MWPRTCDRLGCDPRQQSRRRGTRRPPLSQRFMHSIAPADTPDRPSGRAADRSTIGPSTPRIAVMAVLRILSRKPDPWGRRTPHALNARHDEVHHGTAGSDGAIRIQHCSASAGPRPKGAGPCTTHHRPARLSGIWLPLITPFVDGDAGRGVAGAAGRPLCARAGSTASSSPPPPARVWCSTMRRPSASSRLPPRRWRGASRCSSGCAAAIRGGWSDGWRRRRGGRSRGI